MSLGDVHIMMFYRCPENVNLRQSMKFVTITFLKYISAYHQVPKIIEFSKCFITFGEAFQGRPNYVLKWRLHTDVLGTFPGRQF